MTKILTRSGQVIVYNNIVKPGTDTLDEPRYFLHIFPTYMLTGYEVLSVVGASYHGYSFIAVDLYVLYTGVLILRNFTNSLFRSSLLLKVVDLKPITPLTRKIARCK